jgi:hypothetical protein
MAGYLLGRAWLGIALGVMFACTPAVTAAAASADAAADASREAAAVKLETLAESRGALGTYFDKTTDQYVVVVSATASSTFSVAEVAHLNLKVRVEQRAIDRATIDRVENALESARSTVSSRSYGFGFDPELGMVTLTAEGPESDFASIEKAFPGKISFRYGWFRQTADWANDTQPYWGGAWLNGQNNCTSGFTIEFNSGGRAMVTAGHCNSTGASTNMGTAYREAAAYPYYDFELITGRTYQGQIYDTGSYGRWVLNGSNPSVGSRYCTTGRNSGFQCGWTVRKLNQTICYDPLNGPCYHGLAEFYRTSGVVVVQLGDSGGPLWYAYSSPLGAGVRGVISGRGYDLFQGWSSYATQYQFIANYYVGHAATN